MTGTSHVFKKQLLLIIPLHHTNMWELLHIWHYYNHSVTALYLHHITSRIVSFNCASIFSNKD